MKNAAFDPWRIALATALLAALGSCGSQPSVEQGDQPGPTGEVALALQVGPDVNITSASYAIVGQNGFASMGTVGVGKSADVPVPIAGLPIADGYNITVTANAADGITVCRGATKFDVRANSRASVIVHLVCSEPPRTGSIQIAGQVNVCPLLDGLEANPDQVIIGGSAQLTATAHDADSGPHALTYAWTTTAGTFSNSAVANPTFTCTAVGIATITVTVSDGDADPSCADHLTVNISCKVAP